MKKQYLSRDQKIKATEVLLQNLKANLGTLKTTLEGLSDEYKLDYKDYVYRYYHQSYKVFGLQPLTTKLVDLLRSVHPLPELPLNKRFLRLIERGTGKTFKHEYNDRWDEETLPVLEAFFHAKFFLEVACEYGESLQEPPNLLPSPWAALLYLYNIR